MKKNFGRPLLPGQFVSTSSNALWIGSVVEIRGNDVLVKYFDSPAAESHEVKSVSADTISPVKLDEEQRVYYRDDETREWHVGRVLGFIPDDRKYLVQFPNNDKRFLPEASLSTRCLKPIGDPTSQLAFGLNETAFWHTRRADFVKSLFNQRRACGGMTAILSSAIDIEQHQVAVVRRVLQDPVQRYLLADEVGLGKTIEAGILIRQFVLDEPKTHQILVITPRALLQQWRQELRSRFFLDEFLDKSIHLVEASNTDQLERFGANARMIVIDEAHHVAAGARSSDPRRAAAFECIAGMTAPPDRRVLLLSATPALHNERGFLAMLHLLDPELYSLDDLDAFQERVQQRKRVAEVLSALRDDEPNYFMRQAVEEISSIAPQDERLKRLSHSLTACLEDDPEEDDPARIRLVSELRSHLSETWRLHRRILRTRRSKDVQALLPGRGGALIAPWTSPAFAKLDIAFNEWRTVVAEGIPDQQELGQFTALVRLMAEVIACDPSLLPLIIASRLGASKDLSELALFVDEERAISATPLFDSEHYLLKQLSNLAEDLDFRERLTALCLAVDSELKSAPPSGICVIVFANYPATANRMFVSLQRQFGRQYVFRHSTESTAWTQALYGQGARVLVCDRRAEEGLNLQGRRSVIVHADLPLSPNRLEQRMGRVDRFGSGTEIKSVVLLHVDSDFQQKWLHLLNAALKVFDRSIASLQYVIESEFSSLWANFVDCGSEAFDETAQKISGDEGTIEKEFRNLRSQADLDSFEYDLNSDIGLVERILKCDVKSSDLRAAAHDWIHSALHFAWRGEEGPRDSVLRYQYSGRIDSRNQNGSPVTLLPLSLFRRALSRCFEISDGVARGILYESQPVTFDRQIAQRRFAPLARVGDPLIDGFARLMSFDDRGTSFAYWRYCPDLTELDSPAELAFRFDFVVQADATRVAEAIANSREIARTAIRRILDSFLSPFPKSIWLDSELKLISDPDRLRILSVGYDRHRGWPGNPSAKDFNLNNERWRIVRQWWDPDHWRTLCRRAREAAEQHLRSASQLQEHCEESARAYQYAVQSRCEILESRRSLASGLAVDRLTKDIENERELAKAMVVALLNPSVRVDSIGAIFLSNQNPFTQMPAPDVRRIGNPSDD